MDDEDGVGPEAVLEHIRTSSHDDLRVQPAVFTHADLLAAFGMMRDRWLDESVGQEELCGRVRERVGVGDETPCQEIHNKFAAETFAVGTLYVWMREQELVTSESEEGQQLTSEFNRTVAAIKFSREMCIATARVGILASETRSAAATETDLPEERMLNMWTSQEGENSFQKFLTYAEDLIFQHGYRKYGKALYAEVQIETGYASHAWAEVCKIEDFLRENVRRGNDLEQWRNMTASPTNLINVVEWIIKTPSDLCPELKVDRRLFSFRNGLYNVEHNAFYPFGREGEWDAIAARATEQMREWGVEVKAPTRDDVAIRYFDETVEENLVSALAGEGLMEMDLASIATPEVDKILNYQFESAETIRWFWGMLGRCFYDVGQKDGWQVLFFVLGVGGSGKSTIANTLKNVYPKEWVGVIGAQVEPNFPLMGMRGKVMVMCLEVKEKFGLTESLAQSMISGEDVPIAVKHGEQETLKWFASLFFIGNELPGWNDSQGAISRRMLVWEFRNVVLESESDPLLQQRMLANMRGFVIKANVAYLQLARLYRSRNIWSKDPQPVLPPDVLQFAEKARRNADPLLAMLADTTYVLFDKYSYVPRENFINQFKKYCVDMGVKTRKWTEDMYRHIFTKYGMDEKEDERQWDGNMVNTKWILGVKFPEA